MLHLTSSKTISKLWKIFRYDCISCGSTCIYFICMYSSQTQLYFAGELFCNVKITFVQGLASFICLVRLSAEKVIELLCRCFHTFSKLFNIRTVSSFGLLKLFKLLTNVLEIIHLMRSLFFAVTSYPPLPQLHFLFTPKLLEVN